MEKLIIIPLQALIASSIFFVWVVRYANIVAEFKTYRLPDWLRDLVGCLKLTCALLLVIGIDRPQVALIGSLGLSFLMLAAIATHLRIKNPLFKMLPALSLLIISLALDYYFFSF